ncbi:MAG: aminopeptidase N C-terminal domain-containing protein, partial [Psittacicella sp.]
KIDKLNGHLSSGLVAPFLKLNRYEDFRKAQIREVLLELSKVEGISKNLFEKVQLALESSK